MPNNERRLAGQPATAQSAGNAGNQVRLSRRNIRVQTDANLRKAGLKRPGISNHALRHTAGTRQWPPGVVSAAMARFSHKIRIKAREVPSSRAAWPVE
jgi:integrase